MLTGISVSPEVLSTRNIIIGLVAVAFRRSTVSVVSGLPSCSAFNFKSSTFNLFSSCICSIAFSPRGVAALSSPSMLAAMFMNMLPVTGWPLGMSGNSLLNTGESSRAMKFTTPPFSPTFIMPSHSESTPVSPSEISNAVFDESNVEFIIAGNTSTSPITTSLNNPITNAIRKNATKM